MKTILQLKREIAEYTDIEVGCAQVLGEEWEYEIKPDGTILIMGYIGPCLEQD